MSSKAVFLGSKAFGLAVFRAIRAANSSVRWTILHPDDRGDTRSVLDAFAKEARGTDFHIVNDRAQASALLKKTKHDLGFVCGWYWLLGDTEVGQQVPPLYGIHNSLLPRYRGSAPLVWAMIDGVSELGSTLFRLTPGMDEGPVVMQVRHKPGPDETIADVMTAIEAAYLAVLPELWPSLCAGNAPLRLQDEDQASYAAQRRPEDGEIDWFQPAPVLHNFIRAQSSPYPGAFTWLADRQIWIDRAHLFQQPHACRPGQILRRARDAILVGCSEGTALWITAAHDHTKNANLATLFAPGTGRIFSF